MRIYMLTNTPEIFLYFIVSIAKYTKSLPFKLRITNRVPLRRFFLVMLTAVKLDHQLRLGTIKIYDIMMNYLLSFERNGKLF